MVPTGDGDSFLAAVRARIDPAVGDRLEVAAPASVPMMLARVPDRFVLAFTTRRASVSDGSRDPLDLTVGSGSEPNGRTAAARSLVGRSLSSWVGCPEPTLVSPRQVHGVRVVGAAEYHGVVERTPCDGLTVQPGLDDGLAALLVFADCVPVALLGEVDAALVHGGWRGLLGGVVQHAAAGMTAPPGLAVIGPSIGPCCYEVDEHLITDFARRYGGTGAPAPRHLDLWEVAMLAAMEVGVPRERVVNPRLCTACNPDLFYSYRKDGPATGRHGAVLWSPVRPVHAASGG